LNSDPERPVSNVDWSLVAIVDREWLRGRPLEALTLGIIRGGATVIQYRDKISDAGEQIRNAEILRGLTLEARIPLIINDRLDIAMAVGADGVHAGQDDLPLAVIRRLAPRLTAGLSVSSPGEFQRSPDADYYGVGAVFPTGSKRVKNVTGLDLVRELRMHTLKPLIGIGGIEVENVEDVIAAGCDGVAVISAILGEYDVQQATQRLRARIDRAKAAS
jgi:thiamine-phosphate pyrophosphorylase